MMKKAKEEIIEAIKTRLFGESDVSLPPVNVKPTYLNLRQRNKKFLIR